MSSDDDDIFGGSGDDGDSDDTAALIRASQEQKQQQKKASSSGGGRLQKKKSAPKKKAAKKKDNKPNADDDDSDSDDGLFDSDHDDDDAPKKKPMSKREKMEALAKQKRLASGGGSRSAADSNAAKAERKKQEGYDSGDSYDSGDFQRTAEDDDFLDTTGEDADAVQELYKEQNFDDERPDGEDDGYGPKKKKRKLKFGTSGGGSSGNHVSSGPVDANGVPENPIMAAVHRMKKKKREKKSFTDLEDEAKSFLQIMEDAAAADEAAVSERRPATQKLKHLAVVLEMLTRKEMQRVLLDLDLLGVIKRWIQPLKGGTLPNVTIRHELCNAMASQLTNTEQGITAADLKRSELGKVVMVLYKHPQETPGMKRLLKTLIEQWSRPIFQKSGNMRDLERASSHRGQTGLAALSRQQQLHAKLQAEEAQRTKQSKTARNANNLQSLIATGKSEGGGGGGSGGNRVSIPFSKGFSYSVRPQDKTKAPKNMVKLPPTAPAGEIRGKLSKRMMEKSRSVSKNQRSANISIEGRKTK